MDWVAQTIGVFYAASGFVLVRAMGIDAVAVRLQAALDGRFALKDRVRHILLRVGAALTISSGLALVVLSRWSLIIMVANCVVQGAWLAFARAYFPPQEDIDFQGRRQTVNAFMVYVGATLLVTWLVRSGNVMLVTGLAADWLPWGGAAALLAWMLIG